MKFSFCPHCGSKLFSKDFGDDKNIPFCANCEMPFFPRSGLCVIVIPVNQNNMIALTRQSYGDISKYVLTAGFIEEGETAENACKRELFEELGLETVNLTYLASYYYEKSDNLMLGFTAIVKDGDFNFSNEVRDACWVDLNEARKLLKNTTVGRELLNEYINFLKTHNNYC